MTSNTTDSDKVVSRLLRKPIRVVVSREWGFLYWTTNAFLALLLFCLLAKMTPSAAVESMLDAMVSMIEWAIALVRGRP